MMTNILLTGSGGFIGWHFKSFLMSRYTVFAPRSYELNLLNKAEVDKYLAINKINFIIHCAYCGVRINDNTTVEDVTKPNLEMYINLADSDLPMITMGSGAEYDKNKPIIKAKEEDFGQSVPQDFYGYSKYLISKDIQKRANILNLRVFGVYGLGENPNRVTTSILRHNITKQTINLNQNVRFSFIYIDDLCKITDAFIRTLPSQKFINISCPEDIEIDELAQVVNKISDYKAKIVYQKTGMNKEYTADNSLLKTLLPEFKFTSYFDGLEYMYRGLKNAK